MSGESNYPPGVTGNEPEIAGDTAWEAVHNQIDETARLKGWTDCDVAIAWMLGVKALEAARAIGGRFPSDVEEPPRRIVQDIIRTGNPFRDAMANNRGISTNS